MVKVSIAIPAYNNAEALKRLLESIKIQEYTNYEVIITDDSDKADILQLAGNYPQVIYYKNNKRLGSTANWNEAVSRSSGQYIKMMHHDDWFTSKESLGKLVDMLDSHPEAGLAFSGTRQNKNGEYYDRAITDYDADMIKNNYRNLFLGNTIGAPSAVIYRKTVEQYDEKLKWLVDMEFYMSILQKNPYFIYTKEPLISIGISGEQLTEQCIGNEEVNRREYGYIYKKYELASELRYREKMFGILMDNHAPFEEAKEYGMEKKEYNRLRNRKFISKVKWKLGIRKRQWKKQKEQ